MNSINKVIFIFFIFLSISYASESIKIGASLGLTGKYSFMSKMNKMAYELWIKDVNDRGGILGRKVEIIIYDDNSKPNKAKELYEKLILTDKVDFVLAPYSSGITKKVLEVTEKYGYPLLSSGAAADTLWKQGHRYFFGVFIPANKYTKGFLEMVLRKGMTKIAIVSADDPFSQSIASGANKWSKRLGMDVVLFDSFKKGRRNLDSLAKKIHLSNADVLIVGGHYFESVDMRRSLTNINWYPKAYYASVGPVTQKYYDNLNTEAELTFSSSQWEPYGLAPYPGAKEFSNNFFKRYQVDPTYHASSAYAAGQILETAIKKAKSFDKDKVRDILSSLDTITIMGRYGVDSLGVQIRHLSLVIQWQNGKKEVVGPEEIKTVDAIIK